jgi:hypothetical protein
MKELKIKWYHKLFLKFWSNMAMKILARKMGVNNPIFDKLHEAFAETERIDIFPYVSGSRGFMIIINRKTALYFNQDGDHFIYDGFEMGEYKKGDVAIFDGLKVKSPYHEE